MAVTVLPGNIEVCGALFYLVAETGSCVDVCSEHRIKLSGSVKNTSGDKETWSLTAQDIVDLLDVRVGDRVSAVLLSKDHKPYGPMLFAFNHRLGRIYYFEAAILDLYYLLPEPLGWFSSLRTQRYLKELRSSLPSSTFYEVIRNSIADLD